MFILFYKHLPGTVSPLNVIFMLCLIASCGVNAARNLWFPKGLTDEVTRPPFTRISRFPDPARDPSTETAQISVIFYLHLTMGEEHI